MWQAILLLVLLCGAALMSASETALFGLTRSTLREFQHSRNPLRREAWSLMQHPGRVLSTILIANTTINVGIFAISVILLERTAGLHVLVKTAISAATVGAVLLFADLLPKSVSLSLAPRIAPLVAPIVAAVVLGLAPIRWLLTFFVIEPVTRLLRTPQAERDELSVDELRAVVELSAQRGVINSSENDMLQEVLALPEISVRAVMVPRVDMIAVPLDTPVARVREKMRAVKLTKLPVYGRDVDDLRGLVYAKDLFLRPSADMPHLLREVDYLPEQCNLLQVIKHFRERQTQLAIVVDEYGGVAGLVALEDVLEQIVGDIVSAGEATQADLTQAIDADAYRVSGDLSVRVLAEEFGADLPDVSARIGGLAGVETLGGLVVSLLGHVPRDGDTVRVGAVELTVDRMRGRRIDRLLLRRRGAATDGAATGTATAKGTPNRSRLRTPTPGDAGE